MSLSCDINKNGVSMISKGHHWQQQKMQLIDFPCNTSGAWTACLRHSLLWLCYSSSDSDLQTICIWAEISSLIGSPKASLTLHLQCGRLVLITPCVGHRAHKQAVLLSVHFSDCSYIFATEHECHLDNAAVDSRPLILQIHLSALLHCSALKKITGDIALPDRSLCLTVRQWYSHELYWCMVMTPESVNIHWSKELCAREMQ